MSFYSVSQKSKNSMSFLTLDDLIERISSEPKIKDRQAYYNSMHQIWTATTEYMKKQIAYGRGVGFRPLGFYVFESVADASAPKGTRKELRFIVDRTTFTKHNLRPSRDIANDIESGSVFERFPGLSPINFSTIGSSIGRTGPECKRAVDRILATFLELAADDIDLDLDMGVAKMRVKDKNARIAFNKIKYEVDLTKTMSASAMSTAPK